MTDTRFLVLLLLLLAACSGSDFVEPPDGGDAVTADSVDGQGETDVADNPDRAGQEDGLPEETVETPKCEGKECGPDGLGGSCGECDAAEECIDGLCEPLVEPGCETLDDCFPLVCDPENGECAECSSDDQCAPADSVCDDESGLCVECVQDADCPEGQGCQENECVPLTCPEAPCGEGLVCDEESGQCVPCLTDGDCPEFHACEAFECIPPTPCESSKDCALDEVCDKDKGICVECVTDADCPDGWRCLDSQVCEEILYCESDKECKEYNKVCDKELGECVDCLVDVDCAVDHFCQGQKCLPDVCDQEAVWPACVDGNVAGCSENGSLLTIIEECPAETYCTESPEPGCEPWFCVPDATGCDGSIAYLCNDIGSGYAEQTDCAESDEACSGGECKEVLCEAGESVCVDELSLVTCSVDGTGFITEPCAEGSYCDGDANECVPWFCTPLEAVCAENIARTCNEFGSDWATTVDCTAEDLFCVAGECIPCAPQCTGKECGADGCGGVCGECGDLESCWSGTCVLEQCPESCTGKTVEAYLCGIDYCYPELVQDAGITAPLGDPIDQMGNVAENYGALVPWAGPSLAILGTGNLYSQQHDDVLAPAQCMGDPLGDDQACDIARMDMDLTAPPGVTGFSVDFILLSREYSAQQPFNDKFILWLTASTTNSEAWVINYVPCANPGNGLGFTVQGQNFCYIGTNAVEENPPTTDLSGTGFAGSTGWLRTTWPITAGETFHLRLQVQDRHDGKYDSVVVVDNFQWLLGDVVGQTGSL